MQVENIKKHRSVMNYRIIDRLNSLISWRLRCYPKGGGSGLGEGLGLLYLALKKVKTNCN